MPATAVPAVRLTITDEHERREVLAILTSRLASRVDDYNRVMQDAAAAHPSGNWPLDEALVERQERRRDIAEVEAQIDAVLDVDLPATVELAWTAEELEREFADTLKTVADQTGDADLHGAWRELNLTAMYDAAGAAVRLTERVRAGGEA